jgi:dTDP-4-amino-4,6-dideoxygalactose transaminase
MINVFQPILGEDELEAIKQVFSSNWIGKGDQVSNFELNFSKSLLAKKENFCSTTSCTEGLFLAPELFNFNSEDEIIVPGISFIAVGNSIVSSGAKMVLCDVDKRSLNARVEDIEKKITKKTKAIILNHYGGIPCDMDPILDLCTENNIILIEDSACAVRSFYKGKACGTMGDMGIWSFDAMKILCTGDGGMIYLKSDKLMQICREQLYLGTPAKQKSGLDSSTDNKDNWWEFDINRPGRRAIMNNIAGAIGNAQLKKLNSFIKRRKEIHGIYFNELSKYDWLRLPPMLEVDFSSSYYFFWIQLNKRNELARYLLDNDVYSTFRYWPLNKIKYFGQTNLKLKSSDWASENTLNIPIHQSLSDDEIFKVIDLIRIFGKKYF